MVRICIVTEELPIIDDAGDAGRAMHELALALSANHHVDLIYLNLSDANAEIIKQRKEYYEQFRIRLSIINYSLYIEGEPNQRALSYAILRTLIENTWEYDFAHFSDHKGLAFYPLLAKRQGLAFASTQFVVHIHHPTRWRIDVDKSLFSHEEQLAADYMERRVIEYADKVVATSQYMADWANNNMLKTPRVISVIRNICGKLQDHSSPFEKPDETQKSPRKIREIVILGDHEDGKGIDIACEALVLFSKRVVRNFEAVVISFVGNFGNIWGQNSLIYLSDVSKDWVFDFDFHFGLSRDDVAAYLEGRDDVLVVIPSPYESSPYSVLETLMVGAPLLCSINGGAKELIDERDWEFSCCTMNAKALSEKIEQVISNGVLPARQAEPNAHVIEKWCQFHLPVSSPEVVSENVKFQPLVTVGITHFERPTKVVDAITSIIKQDYANIEILVCDDGSSSQVTIEALTYLEVMLSRVGGKLLRRENGYLGATRNTILSNATGEYIVFLDDDDIAAADMVSTLVSAIVKTKADVVSCLNYFMPEARRGEVLMGTFCPKKLSYFPLGGPLSLSPEQNVFGSATALFRTQVLKNLGGYSETYGVGHEDYELYIKLAISGHLIEICPKPLFFYEVDRPSMISSTSLVKNFNRCFEPIAEHMPPEMADYINLSAGKAALQNQTNRARWLNSRKSTRVIRDELQSQKMTMERALEIAENLAQEEGNYRAAGAFRTGLMVKEAIHQKQKDGEIRLKNRKKRIPLASIKPEPSLLLSEQYLFEARFLLAIGRVVDALPFLQKYAACGGATDDLVFSLAEAGEILVSVADSSAISSIVESIKDAYGSGELEAFAAGARLASLLEDATLARCVLDAAIEVDALAYASANGDVAGSGMDPLEHFVQFGRSEGRVGFAQTLEAFELLTLGRATPRFEHRGLARLT